MTTTSTEKGKDLEKVFKMIHPVQYAMLSTVNEKWSIAQPVIELTIDYQSALKRT